jgi:hypothetical protein
MARAIVGFLLVPFSCDLFAQQQAVTTKPVPISNQRTKVAPIDSARLPVKRVVLYKNGVGDFEHTARVPDSQPCARKWPI